MNPEAYYVYILTNQLRTILYTGVTIDLEQRLIEHYLQRGKINSYTGKYQAYYLLYYEVYDDINVAITGEKEIRCSRREKKMQLISKINPSVTFFNNKLFNPRPPSLPAGDLAGRSLKN
jgi:putative endonuclease